MRLRWLLLLAAGLGAFVEYIGGDTPAVSRLGRAGRSVSVPRGAVNQPSGVEGKHDMGVGSDETDELFCPCCGYLGVISDTYDICGICGWEHDPYQVSFPNDDGANKVSLRQAQKNFLQFGHCGDGPPGRTRKPTPADRKSPQWRLVGEERPR